MPICTNCGNDRAERYCPECGQRIGSRLSMRAFLSDVADDQIGVDAKLPRTLKALFLRPGFLTVEFVTGRSARYIPPFRLYLLSSLLFFVLLSILSNRSDWAERAEREIRTQTDSVAAPDTTPGLNVGISVGGEQWMQNANVDLPIEWLDKRVEANLKALGQLPPAVAMRRVTDTTIEEAPKVMFVLLPVFALMLKLLYARRKRYYIEHFIFALHVHAWAFILFALALITRSEWVLAGIGIGLCIYLYMAMLRMYGQGWFKTLLKFALLGYVYLVLMAVGLAFAFIWALAAVPQAV